MERIRVWAPVAYEDGVVAAALGEPPLRLPTADRIPAPFITIDGRIHDLSSNFLRYYVEGHPNSATA